MTRTNSIPSPRRPRPLARCGTTGPARLLTLLLLAAGLAAAPLPAQESPPADSDRPAETTGAGDGDGPAALPEPPEPPGWTTEPPAIPDPPAPDTPSTDGSAETMQFTFPNGDDEPFQYELLIPILGIVFTFGTPIAIVLVIAVYRYRERRLAHQTVTRFIESGQPVPEHILEASVRHRRRQGRNDLRTGILWLAAGAGVAVFLSLAAGAEGAGLGLLFAFIGLGFILAHFLAGGSRTGAHANGGLDD